MISEYAVDHDPGLLFEGQAGRDQRRQCAERGITLAAARVVQITAAPASPRLGSTAEMQERCRDQITGERHCAQRIEDNAGSRLFIGMNGQAAAFC